jgi:hypothetical protein
VIERDVGAALRNRHRHNRRLLLDVVEMADDDAIEADAG